MGEEGGSREAREAELKLLELNSSGSASYRIEVPPGINGNDSFSGFLSSFQGVLFCYSGKQVAGHFGQIIKDRHTFIYCSRSQK